MIQLQFVIAQVQGAGMPGLVDEPADHADGKFTHAAAVATHVDDDTVGVEERAHRIVVRAASRTLEQ